jgi:chromosomal replication initiator protein
MEDSQVAAALSTQLAERIGSQRFDLWFNSQTELCVRGVSLIVRAASTFVRDWLRTNFADDIRACWEAMVGASGTIEFSLASVAGPMKDAPGAPTEQVAELRVKSPPASVPVAKAAICEGAAVGVAAEEVAATVPRREHEKFAMAGFVVGGSNEYAFRAAELTARGRQQASPLLFCGPTGVGKTHLLRAVQQEYRKYHARAAALYLTAEQFTTSFVEAIRGSGVPSFRQKCRGAQLLAIDDLQFFVGKQRTLEELLYTIDTLNNDGRQLVFSSDRGLADLRALGPELFSRLSGGLVCELAMPEFSTRLAIVRQLA